jgi:hypothetical protein
MLNSTSWLQHVSQRLAANSFVPLAPELYQPLGIKYAVRRSRFEISKFGMADTYFVFAEMPNLSADELHRFSNFSFEFANKNKTVVLPNGFFMSVFCFAIAITEGLDPQIAQSIRQTAPIKHWAAFEVPVVFDLADANLCYFENTPLWGAAYYAGFRREVETNLR